MAEEPQTEVEVEVEVEMVRILLLPGPMDPRRQVLRVP